MAKLLVSIIHNSKLFIHYRFYKTLCLKKIQCPNNFKNLKLNNMLFRNIMLTVFEEGESPDGFKVGQWWGRRFGGRGGGGAGGKKFVWRSKIIQWMVSNQTIWIIIPLFTLCSIYSNYANGAEQILKQIVQIKHNRDNWPEANQLAIYKCGWGFELRTTMNISSYRSGKNLNSGPPNCRSSALTAWPRCFLLDTRWLSCTEHTRLRSRVCSWLLSVANTWGNK